ncbi:hypothetical protein CFC21_033578 [Triticum aestivum]|uniref:indole-3-pyruvate monooxygenase n=2 Tax=Triticum aestivum TaxID=4565 RepID=A0A9R1JK66_WHEAT|nr:hypothetical protein CFC21_033578 [Triticum aestivum]
MVLLVPREFDRMDGLYSPPCERVNGPIVLSAGPAGMVVADMLREQGVPFVGLARDGNCIASLWQRRVYDRLRLHLATFPSSSATAASLPSTSTSSRSSAARRHRAVGPLAHARRRGQLLGGRLVARRRGRRVQDVPGQASSGDAVTEIHASEGRPGDRAARGKARAPQKRNMIPPNFPH